MIRRCQLAACLAGLLALSPAGANERPNIILMMADDLGWGDPSYNGGWIATPALDAMAAEGLRFDRFYAASAVCSPTRASCLTGRNPFRVGVPGANSGRLGADETPLSEVLDGVGYATGHFGKWHLGTLTTSRQDSNRGAPGNNGDYSPPWQHGYDTCFATEAKVPTFHPMRKTQNGLPEPLDFADPNFYGTYYWTPPANPADWPTAAEGTPVDVTDNLSGDDSRAMMDRVIPFIQGAVGDGDPFFTVIWFHTPHKPLADPDGASGVDSADAYTDAIVSMDTQIARLRTELDTLGVTDNTMFWFCSDNGPENGVGQSGPFRARKRSLHEGGVRVPGILVWPDKIPAGRTTDFPAVTSDYYPTILDYLCITVPGQKPIDGISLRDAIENTAAERAEPIGFRYSNHRSWVNQRYKLISKDSGSSFELYDLLADPTEATNIAAAEPAIVARMTDEFTAWSDAVDTDTEYVPPPEGVKVVLSTAQNPVAGEFIVDVAFTEDVTGLEIGEFVISNGTASAFSGSGATYTFTTTPIAEGLITIDLPAGVAQDIDANPNFASNTLSVLFALPAPPGAPGSVLLDDHFDNGVVDGWISQGNDRNATHNITETGTLITSEVVAGASSTNRGIASTLGFEPSARGEFTITFVVEDVARRPQSNGFFLGVVGDNSVFYRDGSTRNFGLTFFGTESRTNSGAGFGLNFGDNFGSTGAELRLGDGDAELASFQDGFTATVHADQVGWSYEITGLNDTGGAPALFSGVGIWAASGTDFATLFGGDDSWHAVTSNHESATATHAVRFDRVRLVEGPEPAPLITSVTPELTAGRLTLQWKSVEGRRYKVERSDALALWEEIGAVTADSNTASFTDPDAGSDSGRHFYRVTLLLAD